MNNSVNSVHNNCLKVTTRHRTANVCSLKKKICEPAGTNISTLNAELGRLCPFSAPRGHTFSTCPPSP